MMPLPALYGRLAAAGAAFRELALTQRKRTRTPRFWAPGAIPLPKRADIEAAREFLCRHRVGIFIVTFNAEPYIDGVLRRVPVELRDLFTEIYVIDDSSTDETVRAAIDAGRRLTYSNLQVLRTPFNRGYGGNQKLGYLHAIRKGLDYVILLHGDGQYPPEYLPSIINAFSPGDVDAVIASRMLHPFAALQGHMPLYKWIGNRVLTTIENALLGTHLSEFHSGYRAYSVEFLKSVRFELNSNVFHFDTEVLIQLVATKRKIAEVAVPTFYGDEISHVNGFEYAFNCVKAVAKYHLTQLGLFYQPNFDFRLFEKSNYYLKTAKNSLHQFVLSQRWNPEWSVADLGANDGALSSALAEKVRHVTSVDVRQPSSPGRAHAMAIDLNSDFDAVLGEHAFDCVVALDVIEHLSSPEQAVQRIFRTLKPGGTLYASTGNIAFWVLRLGLGLGQFNYGKRGILDLTHARLFTIYSFKRLLSSYGFEVQRVQYFGPPIEDMVGQSAVLKLLDKVAGRLARLWPRMFAYTFIVIARRVDALEDVYERTASSATS